VYILTIFFFGEGSVPFQSLETFCARRKKLGRRKFWFPGVRVVAELLIN
jgi:hypothetical protein